MTDHDESVIREREAAMIANWLIQRKFALASIRHKMDHELVEHIAGKIRNGEYIDKTAGANPFDIPGGFR